MISACCLEVWLSPITEFQIEDEAEGGREGGREVGVRLRYWRYPSVLGKINNIIVGRSVWNARLAARETFFRLNTRLRVK